MLLVKVLLYCRPANVVLCFVILAIPFVRLVGMFVMFLYALVAFIIVMITKSYTGCHCRSFAVRFICWRLFVFSKAEISMARRLCCYSSLPLEQRATTAFSGGEMGSILANCQKDTHTHTHTHTPRTRTHARTHPHPPTHTHTHITHTHILVLHLQRSCR